MPSTTSSSAARSAGVPAAAAPCPSAAGSLVHPDEQHRPAHRRRPCPRCRRPCRCPDPWTSRRSRSRRVAAASRLATGNWCSRSKNPEAGTGDPPRGATPRAPGMSRRVFPAAHRGTAESSAVARGRTLARGRRDRARDTRPAAPRVPLAAGAGTGCRAGRGAVPRDPRRARFGSAPRDSCVWVIRARRTSASGRDVGETDAGC